VAESVGNPGSVNTAVRTRKVTPKMMWPGSRRNQMLPPTPRRSKTPPRPDAKAAATVVVTGPEPTLTLYDAGKRSAPVVRESLCDRGCGNGQWCGECRNDIRGEAVRWLRELNVLHPRQVDVVAWGSAWSRELLLARR
jgi:hypothetical protein